MNSLKRCGRLCGQPEGEADAIEGVIRHEEIANLAMAAE
jgi:hypothetical protein